jgi:hypothetical protein
MFEREIIRDLILKYDKGELSLEDLLIEIERVWR